MLTCVITYGVMKTNLKAMSMKNGKPSLGVSLDVLMTLADNPQARRSLGDRVWVNPNAPQSETKTSQVKMKGFIRQRKFRAAVAA